MKITYIRTLSLLALLCMSVLCTVAIAATETSDQIDILAQSLLNKMTLKEKIGQKLMMDFRYWCDEPSTIFISCSQDMTVLNDSIKKVISDNYIGGIILFANNLIDIPQMVTLTDA